MLKIYMIDIMLDILYVVFDLIFIIIDNIGRFILFYFNW